LGAPVAFSAVPAYTFPKVTTGAPIYLVSACTSGEEFISAFRRYADRNGVIFIPIAEPLPAGRRGRFAIALSNGGVMVEGHAEVVSSARTPSVLYGRVGMTVKFLSPDEPSQTILSELEKARTSLRPPAPSVPPRPAEIPAEPRSKPPSPGGRIDAVNALAECVVIGDVSTLSRDSDLGTIPPPMGTTPSAPLALASKAPSGPVPIAAPKSSSGPMPVARPVPGSSTMPPPFKPARPPLPIGDRPKSASIPPAVPPLPPSIGKATTMGMAALDRKPSASVPPAIPGSIPPTPGSGPTPRAPIATLTATTLGMTPSTRPAASTTPAPNAPPPPSKPLLAEPPKPLFAEPPPPKPPSVPATREEAVALALKFAKAVEASGALPDETVKGSPPGVDLVGLNQTMRGTKPAPMNTLIAPPPPIQYPPGAEDSEEKTDLTNIPSAPEAARRTEIGVAVTPSGALVLPSSPAGRAPTDEETRETSQMAAEEPTNPLDTGLTPVEQVDPLGSTQAAIRLSKIQPTIEEPSGDWTMSTGDGSMTITPRKPAPDAKADAKPDTKPDEATKQPAKGPTTDDYIIALDPSRPDGWSEPSKVGKRPEGELPPGPPVSAVASDKPLDSNARAQPELAADEPKIQVDPTLIEPLTPMPVDADDDDDDDDLAEPPPPMPPPPAASTPMLPLAAPPPSQQMQAEPGSVPIFPSATTPGMGPIPITPPRPQPGPVPGSFVTPAGGNPQLANASGPSPALEALGAVRTDLTDGGSGFFRESGDIPHLETDDGTSRAAQKRKRTLIVIIASVVAAALIAVIAILMMRGDDTSTTPPPTKPPPKTETAPPKTETAPPKTEVAPVKSDVENHLQPDASVEAVQTPSKQEPIVEPTPTDCTLTITSVPAEAEVTIGSDGKGPAPVTVTLPCGVATKVTLKKARYQTMTREVTPKPKAKPIKIALARTTFTVKVSSSPPGATVTLGGKTLGMTPTTVKVPAFESSVIKIAKDGYAPDMQKVTPKNNSSSVSVTLKRNPPSRGGTSIKKLR